MFGRHLMVDNTTLYMETELYTGSDSLFSVVVSGMSVYYSIALIVAGCVCNPLAFIVLSRRAFRDSTMSIYLRFLSVMDFAAILGGMSRYFRIAMGGPDIRHDDVSCLIDFFILTAILFSSSWTLVIVTLERVTSTLWPHKVKVWFSRRTAKISVAVIFVTSCLTSAPSLFIFGDHHVFDPYTNTTLTYHCIVAYNRDVSLQAWWWFDSVYFSFLPCPVLIICNIVIAMNVYKSKRNVNRVPGISPPATQQGTTEVVSTVTAKTKSGLGSHGGKQGMKKETSLTITLVLINATFVICNIPICVYGLLPYFQNLGPDAESLADIFLMLMYSNNAFNFLCYCTTGSKFRQELKTVIKEIVCCLWCRNTNRSNTLRDT